MRETKEEGSAADRVAVEFYDMVIDGQVVGSIQLRLGDSQDICLYAGHVGYQVEPEHRGNGYASVALTTLIPIAGQHGFEDIWITCQPENLASCRTLHNAGAVLEGTIDVPLGTDLYARGLLLRRYRLACRPPLLDS